MKRIQITKLAFAVLASILITPQELSAAPNCPPQYLNICKQLIKILEDNNNGNNGKYQYTWDGTHLTVNANFAFYGKLNNSPSDTVNGDIALTNYQNVWGYDAFSTLLQDVVQASQGGQRVYLHLWQFAPNTYKTVSLSNQAPPQIVPFIPPQTTTGYSPYNVPSPVPQQTPTPVPVPSPVPNKAPPQPLAKNVQPAAPKSMAPQSTPPANSPNSISVITGINRHDGKKVDKSNVNEHFVTNKAGNHIERNERAYLVDSNDKLWSCKISGLGARRMPGQNGTLEIAGHVETLQFRSLHIAHVPGNHPMHSGCLISVHK